MRKVLKFIAMGVVALLLVLLLVAFYFLVERPKPQVNGTLRLPDLRDRVEITRDRWGVPHIYAQNEEDLFFAQGFVTAQDRLWQLDFRRRMGQGRLSEIFGEATLAFDKSLRTLGLNRFAKYAVQNLDPKTRRLAEAYAQGVTAFIESHRNKLPLEFVVLRYRPERWTVEDTLAVYAGFALLLQAGTASKQVQRSQARAILGEEKLKEIDFSYSTQGTFLVEANGRGMVSSGDAPPRATVLKPTGPKTFEALGAFMTNSSWLTGVVSTIDGRILGSNNWVVDGSLTITGKPYLANDAHLPAEQPSPFYEIHLTGAGWNVTGASYPGMPGILLGHNNRIAWGGTAALLAVQDLFIEIFDPNDPKRYEHKGQWKVAQVVREEIQVRGRKEPVVHEVVITEHGPVVTEVFENYTERVALSWSLYSDQATLGSWLLLNRARNWQEFRQALEQMSFDVHFVYADVEGNIGYQLSGRVPQRPTGYTGLPVSGWTGAYDWSGFVPFQRMPHVLNPETHFIVTANNQTVARSYRPEIAGEWNVPGRARRAVEWLQSKQQFTLHDMRMMQADCYNESLHRVTKLVVAHFHPATTREQEVFGHLKTWDGIVTEQSVAAAIVYETAQAVIDSTFKRKLGQVSGFVFFGKGMYLFLDFADRDPTSGWFDDPTTPSSERLEDALTLGLRKALEKLTKAQGEDTARWTWGRLFRQRFRHPFGRLPVLGKRFDPTSPTCGSNLALNDDTVAYRQIIDLADLDNSRSGLATGQAGHPFAKHYSDQLETWRNVQPHLMLWENDSIRSHREALLILLPKQASGES